MNISEGSGRHGKRDFAKFLNIGVTSIQEADTVLKIAIRLRYIFKDDLDLILAKKIIEKLYYKTIAYRKKLLTSER